uniref:Uncharacterized protein n=1 Tax=Panagrolaimus superbus TaxID=310955 RepID=A0A914Y6V7_9BILA
MQHNEETPEDTIDNHLAVSENQDGCEVMGFKISSNFSDVHASFGFKYTPQVSPRQSPKNPKSIYRKRKKYSVEEDAKIIKIGKFSRSQINELSKSGKTPSYPTLKKVVDKIVPNIPQYHIPDTEKRKNVIALSFYDFLIARLRNMRSIPSRRLRITIGGDAGDKKTKITFNFNDAKSSQSWYNYSIFVESDGDDSRENLEDILINVEEDIKNT